MVEPTSLHQPRISRETRRLLLAALVALVVLWILARVRFTDEAPPQSAVQPLLSQLAPRPTFADLASEIARIETRVQPSLFVAEFVMDRTGMPRHVVALRVGDTQAVALSPSAGGNSSRDIVVVSADRASGLLLLPADSSAEPVTLAAWTPQRPQDPRFLLATSAASGGVALRPVFVPALEALTRPAWPGQIWKTAPSTDLEPGSFVFTTAGEFAGLVIDDTGGPAIVGGDVLKLEIDRLRNSPASEPGRLGIEVQPLTPSLANATGSAGGVVVTWVDPQGPAAGALVAGDVIEEVNGERLTVEHWAVRTSRVAAGETVTLRVRRGEMREVTLVAGASTPPSVAELGLTMRVLPGVGSEVVHVVPFTAAQRSDIQSGDVITLAGETHAPTPAQVRAAYAAQREGQGVLLAIARGNTHRVVVLER